ncbi:hypothetical protein NQZ68_011423 [Dissostichus eleginoides]|nr:hypothetical protein NQZ68_011423 [Dissostichus eleginoides]
MQGEEEEEGERNTDSQVLNVYQGGDDDDDARSARTCPPSECRPPVSRGSSHTITPFGLVHPPAIYPISSLFSTPIIPSHMTLTNLTLQFIPR